MASVISRPEAAGGFEFVIQLADKNGFTKETKTRIRKQAMKAVGEARRQSGRHGKCNLLQPPADLPGLDLFLGDAKPQVDTYHEATKPWGVWRVNQKPRPKPLPRPAPPMPLSGLEAVMRDHGIDIMDLSALTAVHIGSVASRVFATQPSDLPRLMAHSQSSYLRFAHSRYGHYTCLDDAMICLTSKAHYVLSENPRISASKVLFFYSRALKSLQSTLNDPKRWVDPEVLCATKMLALVELLKGGNWSPHISGASRLIHARGPHSYTTEFEQDLLASLTGPLVCEAFLNNEVLFLEDEDWRALLRSLTKPDDVFSDLSPMAMELADILVGLPGLSKRVTDLVHDEEEAAESVLDELAAEARSNRQRLLVWRNYFDMTMIRNPSQMDGLHIDNRIKHLGTYLIAFSISGRLLQAMCPSQRDFLEDEVLAAAQQIEKLRMQLSDTNYSTDFFLAQKSLIADAIVRTTQSWREASFAGRIIDRKVFDEWCDAIPRKR